MVRILLGDPQQTPTSSPADIPLAANQLAVSINPPTKPEASKAIKSLKSGKAAGPDGIPPEALKADVQTSTEIIHPLLMKIWENEQIPEDWKKGESCCSPSQARS